MSLQIWLPLNGNMNNQGLLGELTETSTPSFVTGKLGEALSSGGCKMSAEQAAQVLNNNEFSICFWIYVNQDDGTTGGQLIFGRSPMSPPNNRKFSIMQYPTVNDIHWSWQNDSTDTFTAGILFDVLPSYKWTHVSITYKNPNARIYINGILSKEFTGVSNSASFAYATTVISNYTNVRYLNDYRVYDNCLSAKEVKEISKGLVLHYKLGGTGGENLVKGNFSCTSTKDGYSQSGNVTCTLSQQDILDNLGKTLTFSYRVKSNGASTASSTDYRAERFGIHGGISGAYTNGASFTMYPFASHLACGKSDGIYTSSWAIPTNISALTTGLLLHIQTNSNDGFARPADDNNETWYLREVKLEWGDKATPWCPSKKDAEYTTLGFGNNIEYDCSGFGNDGTKVGDIAIAEGSPRYSTCTNFNASSYINCGKDAKVTDEITVNIWAHMSTWTTGYRLISCTETGGWNFDSNNGYVTFPIYVFGKGYYSAISSKTWVSLSGGWHMFTGTYDGINAKLYIDGNLEATVSNGSSTKIPIGYNTSNSIFLHAEAGSSSDTPAAATSGIIKESDVRIYATALSADDIKALYNTPISIDANGNIHAYEFKEE